MRKIYVSPSLYVISGLFSNFMDGETSWTVKKNDGTEIDGGKVINGYDFEDDLVLDARKSSLWDE